MERKIIDVMFSLLRYEVCSGEALSDDERELALSERDALLRLSKAHDMEHLVADALSRQGLLSGDDDATKKLARAQMLSLFRYERINYDYLEVCRVLEDAGIEFLPLKGAIIRDLYPQPWMRTSCDVDILVREEALERAVAVLTESLSFKQSGERGYHDISLFSQGGVHLELHFSLLENEERFDGVLARVWDHVAAEQGAEHRRRMTGEYFIFHHIAHMAHHFVSGGCGIKPFLDLAVMKGRFEFDADALFALLDECGLRSFYESALALCDVWFFGAEPTGLTESMQEFVLRGGVYGTLENQVSVGQSKRGGRARYVWGRIFVSTEHLTLSYPSLKGRKWLSPAYQVRRWFDIVFGGRLGRSVQEIKTSGGVSKDKERSTGELLDEIGLK